jgi:ceroid-lipofuscinosis neuronal protein 8
LKSKRILSAKDKVFWNLTVVRAVYGTIGMIGSIFLILTDDKLKNDDIYSHSIDSHILLWSHLTFVSYEIFTLILFDLYFQTFSVTLQIHHALSFLGLYFAAMYRVNHYIGVECFILEASAPFTAISWILIKCKKANKTLWLINQFILVHIFHLRSVMEFLMLYHIYKVWDEFKLLPVSFIAINLGGILALALFLTPYWTYRKTMQIFNPVDWYKQPEKKTNDKKHK